MTLKLDRLPDRESVKVTFTADAYLKAALDDYAEIYRRAYGQKESVADLIPFMLEAFMSADPGFKRARKAKIVANDQKKSEGAPDFRVYAGRAELPGTHPRGTVRGGRCSVPRLEPAGGVINQS